MPITPPTMIIMSSGTLGRFNASVEVMMRFLSIVTPGTEDGLEPVAMIILAASIFSVFPLSPAMEMVLRLSNEPCP
jgi:hypothetical protein